MILAFLPRTSSSVDASESSHADRSLSELPRCFLPRSRPLLASSRLRSTRCDGPVEDDDEHTTEDDVLLDPPHSPTLKDGVDENMPHPEENLGEEGHHPSGEERWRVRSEAVDEEDSETDGNLEKQPESESEPESELRASPLPRLG